MCSSLQALQLTHPAHMIRDTGKYPLLMKVNAPGHWPQARSLRSLARECLGLVIQRGEHCPIDDARAALYLYHQHRKVGTLPIKSLMAAAHGARACLCAGKGSVLSTVPVLCRHAASLSQMKALRAGHSAISHGLMYIQAWCCAGVGT